MTVTDWIQAISTVVLVGVTAFYAWRTHAMSRSAKKQAEEMREQRLSEAQPYLLLRLTEEAVQWETEAGTLRPPEFPITIRNVGKGPAINLEAALWLPNKVSIVDRKGFLAFGEDWSASISKFPAPFVKLGPENKGWLPELNDLIKSGDPRVVAVEYQDINRRDWVTYLRLERDINDPAFFVEEEQNTMELKKNND